MTWLVVFEFFFGKFCKVSLTLFLDPEKQEYESIFMIFVFWNGPKNKASFLYVDVCIMPVK